MTRIKRKFGAAGTWGFQPPLGSVTRHDRDAHDELIEMAARIATMVEVRGLLRSTSAMIGSWITFKGETWPEEPEVTFDLEGSVSLVQRASDVLDRCESSRRFRAFQRLDVHGFGNAIDARGLEHEVHDLLWLHAYSLDCYIVEIKTQSDAWMSCSFRAEPQPEVAKRNAPRLREALRAIESELGLESFHLGGTHFAVTYEYELSPLEHPIDEECLEPDA